MGDETILVDLIEKFPLIWDKKNTQHKDKIALENAWSSIAAIMELTVTEVQNMWEYIRNKYIRERRAKKNIPSGSGASTNTWELYSRLGFLDNVIQTRRTRGNITRPLHNEGLSSQSSYSVEETLQSPETSQQDWFVVEEQENTCEDITQSQLIYDSYSDLRIHSASKSHASNNSSPASPASPSLLSTKNKSRNIRHSFSKKAKTEQEPLEKLMTTCASVGENVVQMLKNDAEDNSEDFHFAMAILGYLKKIKSSSVKLLLITNFLTNLAAAFENQEKKDEV